MSDQEKEPKLKALDDRGGAVPVKPDTQDVSKLGLRDSARQRRRIGPFLITLLAVAIALPLSWMMWNTYMGAPWTRDGTVRAYVVTMAPEVAGRIVELPVADDQYVHKGDLLMVIDPRNYQIALRLGEAAVKQAQAKAQNIDAETAVQQAQISAGQAQVQQAQATLSFATEQATRYEQLAKIKAGTIEMAQQAETTLRQDEAALKDAQSKLAVAERQIESLKAERGRAEAEIAQAEAQADQARINLERTRILSPVNGYVTNLLARLGNYLNVGVNSISLVDADSFWLDGYFEETQLARIEVSDPARIKLMGYREILRGHVSGIARAINVPNAQPNAQGVADVNPIFTWVRLAQRVPVRIMIDQIPPGIRLVAGMTATVQIDHR
ncbi:MAG TPA: HlyD family secretion protein [Methylovirgula sp.]|nr:HlyD family secretion protein [Methylovirgula sp.]